MVADSGAKFAGPVAEHHDGFSMWDSKVNEWNSVDMGPQLDLLKIWGDEIKGHDMKLLVAMHHAFNMNGFFSGAPQMPDASRQKLFGQLPRDEENQLWYDKLREVVDQSQPTSCGRTSVSPSTTRTATSTWAVHVARSTSSSV